MKFFSADDGMEYARGIVMTKPEKYVSFISVYAFYVGILLSPDICCSQLTTVICSNILFV